MNMSEEPVTFGHMCDVVAEAWNEERNGPDMPAFTGREIWDFNLIAKFPAVYLPQLYDAAKAGHLTGLLLTDNTCAGIFIRGIDRKFNEDNDS